MNEQISVQRERLIKLPEVIEIVGLGRTEIYERMKKGTFPACVKNGRNSLWVESEIYQYNAIIIQQSRPQQPAANLPDLAQAA